MKTKKYPICISKKCCEDKYVDLLLIGEKKYYVLIKDFNTFMYDHVEGNIFVVIVCKLLEQQKN